MIHSPPPLPGVFQSLAPTLNHYGYAAVAGFLFLEDFGVPLPGETILIAASVYAGAGRLNVVLVGVLAIVAAVLGDNIGFVIGHFAGHEAVVRWGKYVLLTGERLERAERFFVRHGGKIVVAARFVEGLRQANGIIAGISEMRWHRFLAFNVLGATVWVAWWVTVGYTAGNNIGAIYSWFTRFGVYALVAGALCVVALVVRFVVRRRRTASGTTDGE